MNLPEAKNKQDAYLNYLAGEGAFETLPQPLSDTERRLYAICQKAARKTEGGTSVASISLTVTDGAVTAGTWKDGAGKSHKISITSKSSS